MLSQNLPNMTHKKSCQPSDPINLIFKNISIKEIENQFKSMKWNKPLLAESLFLPHPNAFNKTKQNIQMVFGKIYKRYHIRIWDFNSKLIASVHMDRLRLIGGHTAADFESIEKDLANLFRQHSSWSVTEDAEDLQNAFVGYGQPYNNGKATVIEK
jgi:hypothetical protein